MVYAMQLKHTLGQIDPIVVSFVADVPIHSVREVVKHPPLWHIDAVIGEGVRPIKLLSHTPPPAMLARAKSITSASAMRHPQRLPLGAKALC